MKPMTSVPCRVKSVISVSPESTARAEMEFMKPMVFLMPSTSKFVRPSVKPVMLVRFSFTVKKRVIAVIPIVSIISVRPGIVFASPVIIAIGGTAETRQDNEHQN